MSFKAKYIYTLLRANPAYVAICAASIVATSLSLAKSADYIRMITSHIQAVGLSGLWFFVFMACATQVIHYIAKYCLAAFCRDLDFKLCKMLRVDLLKHWLKMPFASFEQKNAGQYISIAQNDASKAAFYVYAVFSRIGMSVFVVLMALPFMLQIDIWLTVAVMAISFGFGAINRLILKNIKRNESIARAAQESLSNFALSGYESADSVKVYGASPYMGAIYQRTRRRYSKALMSIAGIDGARNGLYTVVNNATLFGSIIYLAWQTLRGLSALGETLSFNILLTQSLVAIEMIYRWSGEVVRCNASWDRLQVAMSGSVQSSIVAECGDSTQDCLGYSVDRVNGKLGQEFREHVNSISLSGLSYSHSGDAGPVFANLSMKLKKGKIYHIAGESGSGKTTLIKCLMGLYNVEGGAYEVDGNSVRQEQIADLISFVPSEHFLFEGTVYENLALGNNCISIEACEVIADAIGIGGWIRSLPGQFDFVVEVGGQNFSGGQRQMLCILRALMFKRPVLVLDEPFSALDREREEGLRNALMQIKDDHIILLTSHRSQTLDFCDIAINLLM
jgi:ABC-type multidrug transport system fused ATPase/permease subunit